MAAYVNPQIPPPPEGITPDAPTGNPQVPPPPEGVTMDGASSNPQLPPPPEGVTVDTSPGADNAFESLSNAGRGFVRGVIHAGEQQLQSAEALQGKPVSAAPVPEGPGDAPLSFGMPDINTPERLGQAVGESAPNLATGFGVGLATTELTAPVLGPLAPVAGLATGALASGFQSAYQTLGPYYKAELDKTPDDPNGAYDRAMSASTADGAWSGVGWIVGAVPFFKGPLKNLLAQTIIVQPTVGVAQKATQNVMQGQPIEKGTLDAAAGGLGTGLAIGGAHALVRGAGGKSFFPTAEELGQGPASPGDIPPPPPGITPDGPTSGGPPTAEAVPTQERFKARPELSNVPQTIEPATQPPSPDQPGMIRDLAQSVYRGVRYMGQPSAVDELPPGSNLTPVTTDESGMRGVGLNQYQFAQEDRRAAKFGNGKIAKENDNSTPLSSAEQGYNNAILQARGEIPDNGTAMTSFGTRNAVAPDASVIPFPSGGRPPPDAAFGSVASMRSKMVGGERDLEDSIAPPPVPPTADIAEMGPALETLIAHTRQLIDYELAQANARRNAYDLAEPRYIVDGGSDLHVYNATDLEARLALEGNRATMPRIERIDNQSLDDQRITAALHDLPPVNDRRVALNGIDPVAYENMRLNNNLAAYHMMIDKGLRVVPSAGSTHMYSGVFRSTQLLDRPPPSARSKYIVVGSLSLYNKDPAHSEMLSHAEDTRLGASDPKRNIGFSTIDVSKLDAKDFVSADYNRVGDLIWKDGHEPTKQERDDWHRAAQNAAYGDIKAMAEKGLYVPVRKLANGDFDGGRAIIPLKKLPSERVRAYAPVGSTKKEMNTAGVTARVNRSNPEIILEGDKYAAFAGTHTLEDARLAHHITEALVEVKPVVDRILERFGAKNRLKYVISFLDQTKSPYIQVDEGKIVFPVESFRKLIDKVGMYGTEVQMVKQVVFHELGHLVTLRSWDLTPPDMQELIQGAYHRSLLRYNIDGFTASTNSLVKNTTPANDAYYLSFREWHAEQFRRWTSSDQATVHDIDRYFKRGVKDLFDLKDEVAKKLGDYGANQMFQADWSFHSWMDYIEKAAHGGMSPLQFARNLGEMALEAPAAGRLREVHDAIDQAMMEFGHLVADDIKVQRDATMAFDGENLTFGLFNKDVRTLRFMMGTMAWIRDRSDLDVAAKNILIHEAWHGIEDSLPKQANALLLEEAKRQKVLSAKEVNAYGRYFEGFYLKHGMEKAEARRRAIDMVNKEWRAKLVELSHHGFRFGEQAQGILDRLGAFVERIGNLLRGKGFKRAEDILHEYYRGEITDRYNQALKRKLSTEPPQHMMQDLPAIELRNTKGQRFQVQMEVKNRVGLDAQTRYGAYDESGKLAGYLSHDSKGEIEMIRVTDRKQWGTGLAEALIKHAEALRGEPFKTAQILTNAGYNAVKRSDPARVKYYVKSPADGLWMSPKSIWENIANIKSSIKSSPQAAEMLKETLAEYEAMARQIPDTANEDPALLKQWTSRTFMMDEWEKAAGQRGADLKRRVTGDLSGQIEDPYQQMARSRKLEAQQKDPLGAGPQPEMLMIQGMFRRFGVRNEPRMGPRGRAYDQDTTWSLHLWGNKMISLGKSALMIRQLAWLNPHIPQLRDYISYRDQQNQRVMQWVARADETARAWDRLPDQQRNGLSDMLFWATEMRYRTPAEVRARVTRQPTQGELAAYMQRNGISQDTFNLYNRVTGDFNLFLTDMERVFTEQIMRRFAQPHQLQTRNAELAKLAADMRNLRAKPYFPMTRFGRYSLTARDPQANNRVTYFELFNTPAQRDAAHRRLEAAHPLNDWSISIVPEDMFDFMGLPGPLLDRIKAQLPGISTAQQDWMDQFANLMAPQNSFKKRWLERRGTPGYSLDGVRAYAQYFRSGSRYLSRIEFNDQIRGAQRGLDQSVRGAVDGTSRQIIADTVNDHANWMDMPGKDWTKLKALTTVWQLGYSPAAALMNLTQVPQVTYPYLSSLFGEKAVFELGSNVARSGARTLFTRAMQQMAQQGNGLDLAHAEMVRQGRIDLGQAAELGSFADSPTVDRSFLGSAASRALRVYSHVGMFMFGTGERFNREWTFETAYKLALAEPNNPHVVELSQYRHRDINDIMARTGMTQEQANAFIVAREAIDRTQFTYQSWDRPKFLRVEKGGGTGSKILSSSRIFFMYTQQMLFALASNPGRLKAALIMGALYGAMGLPGAQDIDSLVHAIAAKIFGKDWKPSTEARKLARELTRGTFLDQVGPDLFLHGISRYGFGIDLLPEHMGWPQFDASANGSMGQVIPGFKSAMEGWANSGADQGAFQSVTTKVLQDWAGPGFGTFFPWLKWATSTPTTGDQSKWETVLPRAFKAWSQAYHMAADGGIRDQNGNLQIKMDWNDPSDRATIIAKAAGFQPRAANERWEMNEIVNSTEQFYKGRKLELTTDMFKAIKNRDMGLRQDVISRIQQYNKDVTQMKRPDLVLSSQGLIQSLNQRFKKSSMSENGVLDKTQHFQQQQYGDLFPGATVLDQRKVK